MALAETEQRAIRPLGQLAPTASQILAPSKLPLPVVLYLLAVILPIEFNVGPLAMSTLRLLLLLMVLPLFGQLVLGRFGRILLTDILFALHILWATIALSVTSPDSMIQQIGSVGVEFMGGYLIGRAYIRTPEDFISLCRWLVFLVLCTAPFAMYEAKSGRPIIVEFLGKLPGVGTVSIVTIEGRLGMERVQSVFAHPIHYGLFCSVALSLAFVAMRDVSAVGWRYFSSVFIAFCGFLALSSGALLAIFLQIGLIFWSSIFARIRLRWWLLVVLFGIVYVIIDIFSNRTPMLVFMSYATFSAHNAYWRAIIFEWGMINIWSSPIFGIGLNDWVRPWYMYSGSMDNFWLVMGVRYGIPGFLLLVAGYSRAIFLIMRRNFETSILLTQIRRAWVFTFLGLSFTLTTVHVWSNIYSFVFFIFGAGIWLIEALAKPAVDLQTDVMDQTLVPRQGMVYSRFAPRVTRKASPENVSD